MRYHTTAAMLVIVMLSRAVQAGEGVFIFKRNSSVTDSSAVAAEYESFERKGATTTFTTPGHKQVSVTRFQPLHILPTVRLDEETTLRSSMLKEYTGRLEYYKKCYNDYPKSRSLLLGNVKTLQSIVDNMRQGRGFHGGRWMDDGEIDTLVRQEAEPPVEPSGGSLGKFDRLVLKDGKVYTDVVIRKKLSDRISITHSSGIAGVSYLELPDTLRKELGPFEAELVAKEEKKPAVETPEEKKEEVSEVATIQEKKAELEEAQKRKTATAAPLPELVIREVNLKGIYLGMPKDDAFARIKSLLGPDSDVVRGKQDTTMGPNVFNFIITMPGQDYLDRNWNFILVDLDNNTVLGVGFHGEIFDRLYQFNGTTEDFAKQFMLTYNISGMEVYRDDNTFTQWAFIQPDFRYVLGHLRPGRLKHIQLERLRRVQF